MSVTQRAKFRKECVGIIVEWFSRARGQRAGGGRFAHTPGRERASSLVLHQHLVQKLHRPEGGSQAKEVPQGATWAVRGQRERALIGQSASQGPKPSSIKTAL